MDFPECHVGELRHTAPCCQVLFPQETETHSSSNEQLTADSKTTSSSTAVGALGANQDQKQQRMHVRL